MDFSGLLPGGAVEIQPTLIVEWGVSLSLRFATLELSLAALASRVKHRR